MFATKLASLCLFAMCLFKEIVLVKEFGQSEQFTFDPFVIVSSSVCSSSGISLSFLTGMLARPEEEVKVEAGFCMTLWTTLCIWSILGLGAVKDSPSRVQVRDIPRFCAASSTSWRSRILNRNKKSRRRREA